MIIKNSDVSKSLSLLGSNDRKDWFTVKEQHRIHSIKNEEKTSEIKILDFPLSDYEFFKIRIDDSTSAPLNIKMAGYSKMVEKKSRYFKIPNPKVEQRDTLKKSIISLQFPSPDYLIERLELSLSGPSYFYRKGKVKVRKDGNGPYVVERFELTSYGDHSVEMRPVRSKGLQIQIANEDNPPLKMEKVKAYQLKRWLIAYLEGGKDYSLLYGDKKANKPEYDLSHFRDSIPDSPPLLDVKKIEKIEKDQKEGSAFFTSRFWIWSGAILVGILLAALSFNMIREVGNRKKDGS